MVKEIVFGGHDVGMGAVDLGEHFAQPPMDTVAMAQETESQTEIAPRHPAFDGIIGQGKLVQRIQQLANGCGATGRVLPPILLIGPSGTGKTEVAQSVGELMGVNVAYINCNSSLKLTALLDLLERMRPHDVAILDEVDKLRKEVQVALRSILEGRQVSRPARIGRRPEVEHPVNLPHVSYIGTTTRPGKMMTDLLNRFTDFQLEDYRPKELAEIAKRVAVSEGKMLEDEAAELLSGSCFGIPRDVKKRAQELCLTTTNGDIDALEVKKFLSDRGIHPDGWSAAHYRLLGLIGTEGAPKARIYNQAGIDAVLVEVYESQLIRAGLIEVQMAYGRMMTDNGLIIYGQLMRIFS